MLFLMDSKDVIAFPTFDDHSFFAREAVKSHNGKYSDINRGKVLNR